MGEKFTKGAAFVGNEPHGPDEQCRCYVYIGSHLCPQIIASHMKPCDASVLAAAIRAGSEIDDMGHNIFDTLLKLPEMVTVLKQLSDELKKNQVHKDRGPGRYNGLILSNEIAAKLIAAVPVDKEGMKDGHEQHE